MLHSLEHMPPYFRQLYAQFPSSHHPDTKMFGKNAKFPKNYLKYFKFLFNFCLFFAIFPFRHCHNCSFAFRAKLTEKWRINVSRNPMELFLLFDFTRKNQNGNMKIRYTTIGRRRMYLIKEQIDIDYFSVKLKNSPLAMIDIRFI